jgi:hypothetical protein
MSQPYGPSRAVTGIGLPFNLFTYYVQGYFVICAFIIPEYLAVNANICIVKRREHFIMGFLDRYCCVDPDTVNVAVTDMKSFHL